MNRRNALAALLAGLTGALPAVRRAAAQHHMMMPATGAGDGKAVLVFAAATLKPALDEAVASWRATGQGGEVSVAYGPTPALAKQIENGAPADIFLSADPAWMDYLAERKLVRLHTRADLVHNVLVLAGRGDRAADQKIVVDRDFPLSKVVGAGPLCMCNPADHPAGRYGKASLQALGLWDGVAGKVAIVDNPQAAVVMVAHGDAPAAVVFATDVEDAPGSRVLGTFPETSHAPIVYPAALTMAAPHAEAADRLLAYLRSAAARTLFDRHGYK
jgi:molybdate transport system substrate-binding protein